MDLYPGAEWHPSSLIRIHPMRPSTLGVVIHWTVGHEAGDVMTLDGPNVDCQFYVPKDGRPPVYQFLDPGQEGWHALHTANTYCVGIEHEGSGEPWTDVQLNNSAHLVAWLCRRYAIPVVHAAPRDGSLASMRGIMGHGDLSRGGVDGNDHTDSVPAGTGWDTYLGAIENALGLRADEVDLSKLPSSDTLRLDVGGRIFRGWGNAAGPLRWIAAKPRELDDPDCAIAWRKNVWRGPDKVRQVAATLVNRYL